MAVDETETKSQLRRLDGRVRLLFEGWVLSVAVLGLLLFFVGRSVPDVLRARSVEIVDGDGRRQIQLAVGHEAVLLLEDSEGRPRLKLTVLADGTPQIELYGPGHERLFRVP